MMFGEIRPFFGGYFLQTEKKTIPFFVSKNDITCARTQARSRPSRKLGLFFSFLIKDISCVLNQTR